MILGLFYLTKIGCFLPAYFGRFCLSQNGYFLPTLTLAFMGRYSMKRESSMMHIEMAQ